jgi:hypothetical protein
VERVLRADPALADAVEVECAKPSWEGIIRRVWPSTKYIDVIVTGAMAQYIPTLEFYGGGLPLTCTMYASSECYFGINLNPMCKPSDVAYTLIPTMGYFEFLPVSSAAAEPHHRDLVDLVDVKLGHEYELVVTTYSGERACLLRSYILRPMKQPPIEKCVCVTVTVQGCIAIAWATCCALPGSRTRRPCSTSCAARTWC